MAHSARRPEFGQEGGALNTGQVVLRDTDQRHRDLAQCLRHSGTGSASRDPLDTFRLDLKEMSALAVRSRLPKKMSPEEDERMRRFVLAFVATLGLSAAMSPGVAAQVSSL